MRILVAGDLDEEFDMLDKLPDAVRERKADAIVFTGNVLAAKARSAEWEKARQEEREPNWDTADVGRERENDAESMVRFFGTLNSVEIPVFFVGGVNDAPERFLMQTVCDSETADPHIHMVHRSFAPLGRNYVVSGFGGEITGRARENQFFLRYPGWEAEFSLDFLKHLDQEKVLVFHSPPAKKGDPDAPGCYTVNAVVNTYRPKVVLTGPGAVGQGKQMIGNTLAVRPGRLCEGDYAVVDIRSHEVDFGSVR